MALLSGLGACASAPPSGTVGSSDDAPPTTTEASPSAASSAPVSKACVKVFHGVTYCVPPGWKYAEEGPLAIGASDDGGSGFVVGVYAADAGLDVAQVLHRAEAEFHVRYPVRADLGDRGKLGRLVVRLKSDLVETSHGKARLSQLVGQLPQNGMLVVLTYARFPKENDPAHLNQPIVDWVNSFDQAGP